MRSNPSVTPPGVREIRLRRCGLAANHHPDGKTAVPTPSHLAKTNG
ncbi:MAG: hypothetical protein R6X34_22940 [Chloroflexota bacterium]